MRVAEQRRSMWVGALATVAIFGAVVAFAAFGRSPASSARSASSAPPEDSAARTDTRARREMVPPGQLTPRLGAQVPSLGGTERRAGEPDLVYQRRLESRDAYLRFLAEVRLPEERELALRRALTDTQHEWVFYAVDRVRGGLHDAETRAALEREHEEIEARARRRVAAILKDDEEAAFYEHVTDLLMFVDPRPFDVPEAENVLPDGTYAGSPATPTSRSRQ